VKHGAVSEKMLFPWEDIEEFNELYNEMLCEHDAKTITEKNLVKDLCLIIWRKNRLNHYESVMAEKRLEDFISFRSIQNNYKATSEEIETALTEIIDTQSIIKEHHKNIKRYKKLLELNDYEVMLAELTEDEKSLWKDWIGNRVNSYSSELYEETVPSFKKYVQKNLIDYFYEKINVLQNHSHIQNSYFAQSALPEIDNALKYARYENMLDAKFVKTLHLLYAFKNQLQKQPID